jgi:hypothetical protein
MRTAFSDERSKIQHEGHEEEHDLVGGHQFTQAHGAFMRALSLNS